MVEGLFLYKCDLSIFQIGHKLIIKRVVQTENQFQLNFGIITKNQNIVKNTCIVRMGMIY